MKFQRLIGILAVLQQKGQVSSEYLAKRFEVSAKTIRRDMEALCQAGIPIRSVRGAGGGYGLMAGYALNPMTLTRKELETLWAGIGSLRSVNQPGAADVARRLPEDGGDVVIDLASFYRDSLSEKITLLRRAVGGRKRVTFHYDAPGGSSERRIEPCQVTYQWSDWYVYGFCCQRQDYRTFKLRRISDLRETEEIFAPHPPVQKQYGDHMRDDYTVVALYAPECRYRLVEERGSASFSEQEDGRLRAEWGFSGPEAAAEWFLSFGSRAEVISPPEVRAILRREAEQMEKLYEK